MNGFFSKRISSRSRMSENEIIDLFKDCTLSLEKANSEILRLINIINKLETENAQLKMNLAQYQTNFNPINQQRPI